MSIVNLLLLLIIQVLYFNYMLTEFLMNVAIHIFDQIHHLTQDQAICKYQSIIFMLIKVIFHICSIYVILINFSESAFEQISDYTRSQKKRGFAELVMIFYRNYKENRKIIKTGSILSVAS